MEKKAIGITSFYQLSFNEQERNGEAEEFARMARDLSALSGKDIEFRQVGYAAGYFGFFLVREGEAGTRGADLS